MVSDNSRIKLWEDITNASKLIQQLASDEHWDELNNASAILEKKINFFFDEEVQHLSHNEQVIVREQGEDIVAILSIVNRAARARRADLLKETTAFVNGKKGINAYKKT